MTEPLRVVAPDHIPARTIKDCPACHASWLADQTKEIAVTDTRDIEERTIYVVHTTEGDEHPFDTREDAEAFLSTLATE